jgi:DNA topoisomerase-3
VQDSEAASASAAEITISVTEPPRRITRGELPVVMGRLIDQVEDPEAKRALENPVNPNEPKGLGTAATRDSILPKLLKSHYIALGTGKDPAIEVTGVGLAFIAAVRQVFPTYGDPVGRALFEADLAEIGQAPNRAEAERRAAAFRERTRTRLNDLIRAISQANVIELDPSLSPPKGGGDDRPPTTAMVSFAVSLAKRIGVRLPRGCKTSMRACRAFLDSQAGPRALQQEQGGEPHAVRAPSGAMLRYARRLAEQQGKACPPEVQTNFDVCRRFLDAGSAAVRTPPGKSPRMKRTGKPLTNEPTGRVTRAAKRPPETRRPTP